MGTFVFAVHDPQHRNLALLRLYVCPVTKMVSEIFSIGVVHPLPGIGRVRCFHFYHVLEALTLVSRRNAKQSFLYVYHDDITNCSFIAKPLWAYCVVITALHCCFVIAINNVHLL